MELPKTVRSAVKLAAMRAKLVFDTYNWEWVEADKAGVPSIKDIEEEYIHLAQLAYECTLKINETTAEYPKEGNAACGRLTVTFVDEHWEFGLELGVGYMEESEIAESCAILDMKLANKSELGYTAND